ncbi:MAG: flagellin [Rhodothalassiaceae bacterium]
MAFSVNTNAGAFIALQSLNSTNSSLSTTQNRISTGLAVGSARDGASTFAIAQNIRADVAGLNSSSQGLDRARSALDVAINAAEATSDLLIRARELAVAAKDESLDNTSRDALNDEFIEIIGQIQSINNSASFNGTNLVGDQTTPTSVQAIDADGNTVFSIAGVDLTTGASGLAVAALTIDSSGVTAVTNADAAFTAIETAIATVNSALSDFGAGFQRLEIQAEFTTRLKDTLEVGIGNLVDADLARESANLQALQVRQQLGLQALSIANQAPGSVLALFR